MKPEQATNPPTPSILVTAATALGRVAGKLAGTKQPSPPSVPLPESRQVKASEKLPKKHKHRLPRRQKKALQRATRAATSGGEQ